MVKSKIDEEIIYAAFLERFRTANPGAPTVETTDPEKIAQHVVKYAAEGKPATWLTELIALRETQGRRRGLNLGLLGLASGGLLVAGFIAYGIFFSDGFLKSLADADIARGLVTFLFAFATIAIFVIASIAVFWSDANEVERRAGLAKELIALMIGVLGTVLGFYFGSAQQAPAPDDPTAPTVQENAEESGG